jgi:hypothetical protein
VLLVLTEALALLAQQAQQGLTVQQVLLALMVQLEQLDLMEAQAQQA